MDPVVQAAVKAGPEWLYVVASILVVVAGVLGVVVWWLLKKKSNERDKKISILEMEHKVFLGQQSATSERLDSRARQDDILEKRLSSGAESFKSNQAEHEKIMSGMNEKFQQVAFQMKGVSESVTKIQTFFIDFAREYVRTEQFNRHCDEEKEARRDLKNEMNGLTERMEGYSRDTLSVLKVMEGKLSAMSDIIIKRQSPVGSNKPEKE